MTQPLTRTAPPTPATTSSTPNGLAGGRGSAGAGGGAGVGVGSTTEAPCRAAARSRMPPSAACPRSPGQAVELTSRWPKTRGRVTEAPEA
jgi:hypothetical protein